MSVAACCSKAGESRYTAGLANTVHLGQYARAVRWRSRRVHRAPFAERSQISISDCFLFDLCGGAAGGGFGLEHFCAQIAENAGLRMNAEYCRAAREGSPVRIPVRRVAGKTNFRFGLGLRVRGGAEWRVSRFSWIWFRALGWLHA